MAVQTPSYWKEEKYQPLVEVETAYGNKVKIPERCLIDWEAFQDHPEIAIKAFKQALKDGLYEGDKRRKFGVDLRKVFIESYQE